MRRCVFSCCISVIFIYFTSHKCATTGASAQECSAFRPFFPFLNTTTENDLSNHLQTSLASDRVKQNKDFFQSVTTDMRSHNHVYVSCCIYRLTDHSTFHAIGTLHSGQDWRQDYLPSCLVHHHTELQKRLPSQCNPKSAYSHHN